VQVASDALGLVGREPPTVTGGLTFAGGPGNNYVSHALATMVGRLRAEPGTTGLVSGNGWFLTKHSLGLFAAQPPPVPYRNSTPQPEIDALPRVDVAELYSGPATLETYTVVSEGETRDRAIAACRTPDGRRTWVRSSDPAVVEALRTQELLDAPMSVHDIGFSPR
jgi:acetyl-CoA C-acetyltransferase